MDIFIRFALHVAVAFAAIRIYKLVRRRRHAGIRG